MGSSTSWGRVQERYSFCVAGLSVRQVFRSCCSYHRNRKRLAMWRGLNSRRTPHVRLSSAWCYLPGIVVLAVLLTFFARPGSTQVLFGSVVGNVLDASGASVPGATVTITQLSTNDSRTVQTNDTGSYTVSTVAAGTYRVEI